LFADRVINGESTTLNKISFAFSVQFDCFNRQLAANPDLKAVAPFWRWLLVYRPTEVTFGQLGG